PGDQDESFVIFRPFVPFSEDDSRKNLQGFMVVHSDPDRYGEIEIFDMQSATQVDGPALFNSKIQTDEEISKQVSLLNQNGSIVVPGNVLMIPVENSIVYVRPLFIQATGSTAVPNLQNVIVAVGEEIVIADSFEEALEDAVPGLDIDLTAITAVDPNELAAGEDDGEPVPEDDDQPEPDETVPDEGGEPEDLSLMALIERARDAFDRADEALRDGDLAGYQDAVREAEDYIARAELRLPPEADPPTTTSTTQPAAA
ncbi:MAG: UPF0182 family protein, partial [Actinomycetota bacterium]|nr:UPF0182 family protein [Actinomycetota bacterium]